MSDIEWITASAGTGFGEFTDADEFLHGTGPEGDTLTETWFWGFNVPEHAINCYAYCWVHPNLEVASAGLLIYRGITPQHMACELFDYRTYLSAGVVGDGSDIQVPGGLRVQVIDPLRTLRMTYADPGRDTELDITMTAIGDPIMRANSLHFEQLMRTRGDLVLRGEALSVDSVTVRDRSWGELRPEGHVPVPPYNWITAVFDEGALAVNVGSFDDPDAPGAIKDGWVRRDGELRRLVRATKRIVRDPETLRPVRYEIDALDTEGASLSFTGEVIASVPHIGWHNMICHLALVRWDFDGAVGHGESQDCQWNDYVWRNTRPPS